MRWSTRYNRKLKKYYTFLSKSSVFNEFTDKVIYRTPLECFHILEWFGRYSLRQASKIERFSKLALTPCQYPVPTKFQQNIAIGELIDLQEIYSKLYDYLVVSSEFDSFIENIHNMSIIVETEWAFFSNTKSIAYRKIKLLINDVAFYA